MSDQKHQGVLDDLDGFDWDDGNVKKNVAKHQVTPQESEEVFYNEPLLISFDYGHSAKEERYRVLGQTNEHKQLFIVFAIRNRKIRIISSRRQSKKERGQYE